MNFTGLARSLAVGAVLMGTPLFAGEETVSFTRSGQDLLSAASLGTGEDLAFAYDASNGQMTRIKGSAYSLSLASDPLLHLPLSQTISDASDTVLLSATIAYDAHGLRANRVVSAGSQGAGSSTTSYWYGGQLHPLVVERDGVTYRLIGKGVTEALAGSQVTRTYAHADHLGSVHMVTGDAGNIVQSLSYDGDYGLTRIAGQSAAATDDSVASFYRFQGQEQEIFPFAKLGIEDEALGAWLDRIELYHFPWRDYAAGLAAFTQTDPIPTQDSLYAAFAANPVNATDETGGMMQFAEPLRYSPAHLRITPRVQTLLNRLVNPSSTFEFNEILELNNLRLAIVRQRYNPNNPFEPTEKTIGEWNPQSYSYEIKFEQVTERRLRDAEEAFGVLREQQNRWLDAYSRPIGQLWGRMNASSGRNMFGETEEKAEADEPQLGQDDEIPEVEEDSNPLEAILNNAPDQDNSRTPEPPMDLGPENAQPPLVDEDISVQNPPVQPAQENEDDRKQEEEQEEHRGNDRFCCHIL